MDFPSAYVSSVAGSMYAADAPISKRKHAYEQYKNQAKDGYPRNQVIPWSAAAFHGSAYDD